MKARSTAKATSFIPLLSVCFFFASAHSIPSFMGIHPLDERYYSSEVIKCKDGSRSFTRDRLNDDYCDCFDGTDEPGTSACAAGKFYCRNVGSTPQFIFSSHVNDRFCDCCDGSDEYDSKTHCPNTCVMGGSLEFQTNNQISSTRDVHIINRKAVKDEVNKEDSFSKLGGLKLVIILQVALICYAVVFWVIRRRVRSKRSRHR